MTRFQQVLVSRIKSYLWRAFGIGVVSALTWMASNVGLLELPDLMIGHILIDTTYWVNAGLGLLLSEVTKYFNVNRDWVRAEM